MKSPFWKKALPHIVAVATFLIIAIIYCEPALEGKVLQQHDITQWTGANKQSVDFKEKNGHYPLWTNSMFSGMPTFQIAFNSNNEVPWIIHLILTLGLPEPVHFFFIACICFYFLSLVLRVNPYVGIMGALAFAYSTYDPVIISVGHVTKMLSIAYMPALLASILLIFEKRYWIGASLTMLFTSVMIAMNHLQIDYYLFITIGIMTLFFIIKWIREKQWKHLVLSAAFAIGSAFVGVATNAVMLLTTYEYQKETIRGGASELSEGKKGGGSKTGLDKDYAFSYSIYPSESFVLLLPHIYGGSSDKDEKGEESKAVEVLSSMPQELQSQLPLSYYWGGIGFTSGPPYVGAIVCFLAILGMVILDGKHKWWLFSAFLITVMISWGGYFESFNGLLFQYFPFFNKFRAPSMILVIPQLILPILAILTLNKFFTTENKKDLLPSFKKGLYITGGVFAVLFLLYFSFDFQSDNDRQVLQQVRQMNQPQLLEMIASFFNALKDDRRSLMINDIFRAFGFIAVAIVMLFLLIKKTITPLIATLGILVFSFIDIMTINVKYLNKENYIDPEENIGSHFTMSNTDSEILKDKGYYRVYPLSADAFNESKTSYYHNSIGGYHAAKLRIYQDLIENQLSKTTPNFAVLNMLNTKYLIQDIPQINQKIVRPNPNALGPAWLIKTIQYVPNAKAEMAALDNFNPRDTAYIQEAYKPLITSAPQWDSTAAIMLIKNNNDTIDYSFSSHSNQFAVFSEIYYKGGWKAYIDNREAPIVKVNYVLRGLSVPAGKHSIQFRFEPQSYSSGRKITSISSIIMLLVLLGGIVLEVRKRKTLKITNPK